MAVNVLTPAQANLELSILNAEASSLSSSDFYAQLKALGLPDEVAIRLKGVAEVTAEIGKRVINVGKMILMKIIEFVRAHPNMAIGIAVGAAISAMVNLIPWIGPLLAPIAALIGVTIGALAGHGLDKAAAGLPQSKGPLAITQDVIEIASAFFKLLMDVFNLTLIGASIQGA